MIRAEDERPRSGKSGFRDSLLFEFCDCEHDVFGLLRLTRIPETGRAELMAVMFVAGQLVVQRHDADAGEIPEDWRRAAVGPACAEVLAPLGHWRAAYAGDDGFDLDLIATSPPVDLDDPALAEVSRATGVHGFEQLCTFEGTVAVEGRRIQIGGDGRRVRTWGVPRHDALGTVRSVYATAGGSAVSVSSVRPAGAEAHDQELLAGHLLGGGHEPLAFEQVRLSTVYDREGRPRQAGLELLSPGEEMPRRVAGEATCGILVGSEGTHTWLAFFRWSLDGVPGCGTYQLHRRP